MSEKTAYRVKRLQGMSVAALHSSLQVTQTRLSYLKGEGDLLPQDDKDKVNISDARHLETIKKEFEIELALRRSKMH